MKKTRSFAAVRVEWHDAFAMKGWHDLPDALTQAREPLVCTTLGWLVYKDKRCLIVAQSLSQNGTRVGDLMVVPRGMVRRVIALNQAG